MTHTDRSENYLTRRAWLVLTGSALSACGGGGGQQAGLPGTGGTGSPLFAQGSISGFGSVIVNGIRFDDMQARVLVDGLVATSADLRLGMVAEVQGERGADLTLGTASRIEVWTIAQGAVVRPDANGFGVAGMTIQTTGNTVFDGISAASQLVSGQTVAVWGLQVGADGTRWSATRVAVLPGAVQVVSSGMVSTSGTQRLMNGLVLTGSMAKDLSAGALVRVQGVLAADGNSIAVISVKSLSAGALVTGQGDVEIEAYVTAIASTSRFTMGNIEVDASSAIYTPSGTIITVGARVQIQGTWAAAVLKATKVGVEDAQELSLAEISGTVTTFTSAANFVLRGQRCDASNAAFSRGKATDLRAGVKVKVKGTKAGDVLRVSSLEFND
jgi:hypothetical protein